MSRTTSIYFRAEWVQEMTNNNMPSVVRVLQKLKNSSREYVSGEALSDTLGVSRTAVWKYIKELKEKGYTIESSSKKGYRLVNTPGMLNEYELSMDLQTKVLGKNIYYFDSIGSTNDYAKKLAFEGCEDGSLVVAEVQTAGKGRLGRVWDSAGKKGIWMSVVLKPDISPEDVQIMTLAASIAVAAAVKSVTGVETGIKWPNDIVLDGKKVCGILTEMNTEMERVNFLVLGIGINVNHDLEDFPPELSESAISLKSHINLQSSDERKQENLDRSVIIKAILLELEKIYSKINKRETYNATAEDIISEWRKYSLTLGREVRVASKDSEFTGHARDITADGRLVIECADGTIKEVLSGEVSVRGMLGYI